MKRRASIPIPSLKKATRLKNRRRKTTGLQIFYPEIYAGWAAKGEEAFKAFKGGSRTDPLFIIEERIPQMRDPLFFLSLEVWVHLGARHPMV